MSGPGTTRRSKASTTPLSLYRVVRESAAQSRFEVAVQTGLTPLVGRDEELGLLRRALGAGQRGRRPSRAAQRRAGHWQIPPGAGAQRAGVRTRARRASSFAARPITRTVPSIPSSTTCSACCSLQREDTPQTQARQTPADAQRTIASPRPIPCHCWPPCCRCRIPTDTPPLTLSPQKQKEKTQEALVAWLVEEAEQQAVYLVPGKICTGLIPPRLEVLTLFLDQVPTTRLLAVLTFRPEFTPPWGHAFASQLSSR